MLSTLNISDVFSCDGSNRDFTYSFQILSTDGSDIQIWLTSPAGVVSQVSASYSIDVTTSTVTYPTVASLMAPLPTGWTLELRRVTPKTQSINLINQGSLDSEVLEGALDKAIAVAQEVSAEVATGVAGPTGPTGTMLSAGGITALDEKTTPAANDLILLEDSADSMKMKKITKSNLVTRTTNIVNADIASNAAIADTKLATISTAGKVSLSAISNISGIIVMWSGTVATIPTGWFLCDGNNSTPDLRDRFIVGAKQDDSGVAKTNVTGSLTQSGNGTIPAHTHGLKTVALTLSGAGGEHILRNDGSVTLATESFGTGSTNIAVYYALAFIMKS